MPGFKIAFILIACAIITLHVIGALVSKKIGEVLGYVNIGLHLLLIFVLMALKTSFEFMALSFMVSLLIYLLPAFISYKVKKRREEI